MDVLCMVEVDMYVDIFTDEDEAVRSFSKS